MKWLQRRRRKRKILAFRLENLLLDDIYANKLENAALEYALSQIREIARVWEGDTQAERDLSTITELARPSCAEAPKRIKSPLNWLTVHGRQRILLEQLRLLRDDGEHMRGKLKEIHALASAWQKVTDEATLDLKNIAIISRQALD